MRNYQLTLVLNASLKDAEQKKLLESIKDFFKGAKFTKEEAWGEKQLAYKINKQERGVYVNFLFEMENGIDKTLDKRLISDENILRYLIIRTK